MGQVLSCETGLIPRCRSYSQKEKATSSHGERLAWEEPRAVGDLVHVEKFFARNLGGLIHARTHVLGRLGNPIDRSSPSSSTYCAGRRALVRNHLRHNRRNPPSIYAHRMRHWLCPILKSIML